ncbi:MAG: ribonuclease HII [Flavobacteriaceae bacterium]|nr:ribonuclease HII [Flavobacteriaceae bacterium]
MAKLQKYYRTAMEAGTDEAGRGCLAGPVTAAAVLLPEDFNHPLLNDSKQLTEKQRMELKPIIEEAAISFGVSHVHPAEIDKINILNASILAMHRALEQLQPQPVFVLVDGNRFQPYKELPYECMIKGDARFMSIAAASVLAKTYRDLYMQKMDAEFPIYLWKKNKGYPTVEHREAIRSAGPSPYHRKSFKLLPQQLKLEF